MYYVLVLFLLLYCFIFILVLLLCSLYCNINSDLGTLCLACYYFYIVYSLYLYCCYVMYPDHHFTVIYLLQTCLLCVCLVITSTLFYLYSCTVLCCVSRSSLYCNIPSDLCTLFVLLLLLYCFNFIIVLLLCCVSRSSLYCNIPFRDLCTLCLSCYYF